jgi:hypothetical protein
MGKIMVFDGINQDEDFFRVQYKGLKRNIENKKIQLKKMEEFAAANDIDLEK